MSNSRLKSFIDRVLRLKEEEDTIKADIREVYAEMKGEGFDKTVAGQVVAHLRKVDKKGLDEVENANAVFELYLNEYENGTGFATRAHTHEQSNQPETATRRVDDFGSVQDALKMSSNGLTAGVAEQQNDTGNASNKSVTAGETATVSHSSVSQAPRAADDKGRSAEERADRPTEQGGGDD